MSFSNTSVLINSQVPEFIREEYPLFIDFLKAYYQFLEQEQFDAITGLSLKNNLTTQLKDIRNVVDVDKSIEQFEENFLNTFLSLVPKDAQVNKEFLVKNILPLYLAKGIDESFKLLFKLLYNEEVNIEFPKDNILRASDGKWVTDRSLKIESDVRSVYVGDGVTKIFSVVQPVSTGDIDVYVNNVLKQENIDYEIRKEAKKIIFTNAPSANSTIRVNYSEFDYNILQNRKVTGLSSGASAIVERAIKKIITDNLNFGLPFELFINPKTVSGSFLNGEEIESDIIDSEGKLVRITADTFSILTSIRVVSGGRFYNVGDPVLVLGGGATSLASAEVESVEEFDIARIVVDYGGAGFKNVESSYIGTNPPNTGIIISGYVDGINTSHYTANSYYVMGADLIDTYKDVVLSAGNYGMSGIYSENLNTRIVDSLKSVVVTNLGPVTNAVVIYTESSPNSAKVDITQSALYPAGSLSFDIKEHRSIGRIDVVAGGINYKVGDEVDFSGSAIGFGAAAAVKTVNASGRILTVEIQPPRISGTANVSNNTSTIFGTNTYFATELAIGDKITYKSQERYIDTIVSNTVATTNVAFSFNDGTVSANNYKIGSFSRGLVGGTNYIQNNFPTLTVNSSTGSGANIAITSLMGDGENIRAVQDRAVGKIISIKVTTGGSGYRYIPQVDLTQKGDGGAVAEAAIGSSFSTFPGRWKTTDSIISSYERRMQGGNYYFDYSYVTSSIVSFKKYKDILKQLLHPAGFVNFSNLSLNREIKTKQPTAVSYSSNTISGFVSTTNNSIYIIGTNTKFNIANTKVFTIGSNVSVNGQIRTISSIISNTNLTVSSAFTMNSNNQILFTLS